MKYKTVQERDNFNPSNHYFYVFTKTKQWFLFEVESKNKNIDILKEAVKSFCRAQNRPIEMIDVIHNTQPFIIHSPSYIKENFLVETL